MGKRFFGRLLAIGTMALATPALAQNLGFESQFDTVLGTEVRTPQSYDAVYSTPLERQIAQLADGSNGRIGVYAIDLATGREIGVLADQRFPMASTSKVAIAATFLAGVDAGKWSLTSEFRLPRPGGAYMPAHRHLSLTSPSPQPSTRAALARQVARLARPSSLAPYPCRYRYYCPYPYP